MIEGERRDIGWQISLHEPGWNIVCLARATSGDVWAIAQQPSGRDITSHVLSRGRNGWDSRFVVRQGLMAVCAFRDGSAVAVGHSAAHFDGRSVVLRRLGAPCCRVWGAQPSTVYALSHLRNRLFWFDGRRWARVNLARQGAKGSWVDGVCDPTGVSWVVGINGSHSCVAKGIGARWAPGGSASWYLYDVAAGDDGTVYLSGGDGLWWQKEGQQGRVDGYGGGVARLPLDIGVDVAGVVVVTVRLDNLVRSLQQTEGSEIDVFSGGRWWTIPLPDSVGLQTISSVLAGHRMLLAHGSEILESGTLP